jgi:hypothetical protein
VAATVQIPPAAADYIEQLQNLVNSGEGQIWAGSLAACLASLELGYVASAQACLDKLAAEFAAYLDPRVKRAIASIENGLGDLVAQLEEIYSFIGEGVLGVDEAIDGLLELGIQYSGPETPAALSGYITQYLQLSQTIGGGHPVASAIAPVPLVTNSCSTKAGSKGICCAAFTQLGPTRAAQGFQYTNCNGKVVCLACGTKTSVSKKNPGATVFSVKRVSCGVSGCPALSAAQGQIILAQ